MKISKLTITEQELAQAVEAWLETKGISIPVEEVGKEYSYQSVYTVKLKEEPEAEANPPAPQTEPTNP